MDKCKVIVHFKDSTVAELEVKAWSEEDALAKVRRMLWYESDEIEEEV